MLHFLLICIVLVCHNEVIFGQKGDQSKSGCSVNNGTVTVPVNATVNDESWWYTCSRDNKWTAKGCVVNGRRYKVGEEFFGYLDAFYGKCELLDGKYLRTTVLGCIDVYNNTVQPGNTYLADPLFWANCTSTEQIVSTPELGNVTLNIIGRKIIGCNDGSNETVPDDGNFVQVTEEAPLLSGIGFVCKIQGPFPQAKPAVCVVANNSETDDLYVGLADHCYAQLHRYVFYCTISGQEDPTNGTALYGWEVGWNVSTPEFIDYLKGNDFHDCINEKSKNRSGGARTSIAHTREKREYRLLQTQQFRKNFNTEPSLVPRPKRSTTLAFLSASSAYTNLEMQS